MKLHIFNLFLVLLLLATPSLAKAEVVENEEDDQDITKMTFLVEFQPEDDNDVVEIGVLIETQASSLREALKSAGELVASVTRTVDNFCSEYAERETNCDEALDVGDFQINADYEKVRRNLVFNQFIVSHEVTIKVFATEKIGELADSLLKIGVTKIESFEWTSTEQDDGQEGAIQAGQEKSHDMCFHLGMKLHRIVSVQSIEEEEEEGKEDQQEQEEEEEEGPIVYKFQIECIIDGDTAREKAAEEAEQDRLEKQKEEKSKKEKDDEEEEEDKKSKKKSKKQGKKKSKQ